MRNVFVRGRLAPLTQRLAGVIGNIFDHYDNALYGLLAPFIAPLFFDASDPIAALILTYSLLPLSAVVRPLGSLFFGWLGDRYGRRIALFYSLSGMAVATVLMGFLPTYQEVGYWASLGLALCKTLQGFFAAGETVGGAIYVLEWTEKKRRGLAGSLYDACSIGGIFLASTLVTLLSAKNPSVIEMGWRWLCWSGAITALIGLLVRLRAGDSTEYLEAAENRTETPREGLLRQRGSLLRVIIAAGFTYSTYSFAFTFMNGFVPLISPLTKTELMQLNTALLCVDMALLPVFGMLGERWGKRAVMKGAALLTAVFSVPLFLLVQGSDLMTVSIVRFFIVLFGVAFAAQYHAWSLEEVPPMQRYTILSLGYAIGSQLIGAPTAACSLWLYHKTGWVFAPGLYLAAIAAAAAWAVRSLSMQVQREDLG